MHIDLTKVGAIDYSERQLMPQSGRDVANMLAEALGVTGGAALGGLGGAALGAHLTDKDPNWTALAAILGSGLGAYGGLRGMGALVPRTGEVYK